ncbi:ABC transporter ATP-binding protein [Herbiconiux moechotypicola]|uniref:ABC transporter ATP-binding protein n=1 Tax=Herbiconiux moechotypicola TaxID=637393 RepID=A0ABN3DCJ4_9MICO|nr:ABC transporter ATP-binding protein [Herbiconiux moechotypicola]MCS5728787.1 ABC transporter ATP-binding protein [Herbiconiux moechotypicola]
METVVRTEALRKRYGRSAALDGLDLEVAHGEVHGFLGPNGAGKSTTIRILLGLARASGGTATVLGGDPWRDAARLHRRIASVPGDVSLWPNLSGGEAIDLLARLRGGAAARSDTYRRERQRLVDAFEFDPRKKGRAYSKGNRQKVALIAAFALPAELYVFDEPTSGLDPLMERVFQRELARVRDAGASVLLSSHILSEVEQLCDRVSIIRAGRVVETGTLDELRHLTRTEVSYAAAPDARGPTPGAEASAASDAHEAVAAIAPEADGAIAAAERIPGAHDVTVSDGRVHLTLDSDAVAAALPALAALGVRGLRIEPPSLEELFLRHYGEHPADTSVEGRDPAKTTTHP